jgi:hypothetical protein
MADFDNTRSFQYKPDFDMCMARIYAWYEQRIIDRPPLLTSMHIFQLIICSNGDLDLLQ